MHLFYLSRISIGQKEYTMQEVRKKCIYIFKICNTLTFFGEFK